MKIAYIMLCHKNSKQLNDLIEELSKNNSDIYIHIDKKSNISSEINTNKNIFILPDNYRCSIGWGSNEMIVATLNLIRYVQDSNKEYDYICLISGQDYPIVSSIEIIERLKVNKKCNYIEIIDKDSKLYNRYKKLYEIWYPKWITRNKLYIKIIKRLYMFLTGGFNHTFKIFKRKKPFDFDFYFGSQWWCLTTECAYYILNYCDNNPDYLKYFDNVIIPDECFFQSIFMNSEYSKYRNDNLTFVNWKKNRRSPETLILCDFDKLIIASKNKIFARKFDIDVDEEIIKRIKVRNNDALDD